MRFSLSPFFIGAAASSISKADVLKDVGIVQASLPVKGIKDAGVSSKKELGRMLQAETDTEEHTEGNYTEKETKLMAALEWCTGGEDIAWINKSPEAIAEKVRDGSVSEPARDEQGKIEDLAAFVSERLEKVPVDALLDNLPTIILENQCAYTQEPTEECAFDYVGTPNPHQFAFQDELGFVDTPIPDYIRRWDQRGFTVVHVPPQNTDEGPTEITSNTEDGAARAKLRGNSSKDNPKKQMQLRFQDEVSLIPGTPPAKKWILSAKIGWGQPDRTYVVNPMVFETYRRLGELQKQYLSTWPENGSIEDKATEAWAPHTMPVNVVFQGRFLGLYNILEEVEVLDNGGRVWLPEEQENTESVPKKIDNIMIPTGNYFLEQDSTPAGATTVDDWLHVYQMPAYPEWVGPLVGAENNLSYASFPVWAIGAPKHVSFNEYSQQEEDPDVHNLRMLLDQVISWAVEDPIANDDKLAQVIDMKSYARYYLISEMTREGDAYLVSAKWKFVKGKLYNAAAWDYAGGSFYDYCGMNPWPIGHQYINYENNTIENYECDTNGLPSEGWHVDRVYFVACAFGGCDSGPGTKVDNSSLWDINVFYRNLFRAPSLQEEFWALWDLAAEHKLIDEDNSTNDGDAVDNNGDLFSADKLLDQMYLAVNNSARIDSAIWNPVILMGFLGLSRLFLPPVTPVENCSSTLAATLFATVPELSESSHNPFDIPAMNWTFTDAETIGRQLTIFFRNMDMPTELSGFMAENGYPDMSDFFDPSLNVEKAKRMIKARLEWIGQQRPKSLLQNNVTDIAGVELDGATEPEDVDEGGSTSVSSSCKISPPFFVTTCSAIFLLVTTLISLHS